MTAPGNSQASPGAAPMTASGPIVMLTLALARLSQRLRQRPARVYPSRHTAQPH